MRLLDAARRGLQSVGRGTGGGWWYGSGPSYGSGLNWSREAGLRYDNSIVYAAVQYAANAMTEVDMYVRRPKGDGTFEEVHDHPITVLLRDPNPWYGGDTMMSGWIVSELVGSHGQSYTFKHRSSGGKLVALEFLPHHVVQPYVAPGSGAFVDNYRLAMAGGMRQVPPQDMLVQRYGPINPHRPQVSIGPLEAAILEVATDKTAARYTAALLRNVGVTPHLVSPALKTVDGEEIVFGEEQVEQIKSRWEEQITGDNRGRPLIMPLPINVQKLSMSPSDMDLAALRNVNEERVCAVMGIPPIVLNLGTGLEQTNNRASAEAAYRQAAISFVLPYMRKKSRALTRDLVPELGQPGDEVCFRTSEITALASDELKDAKRDQVACGGAWQTVNEVRAARGLPPIEGGDDVRAGTTATDKSDSDKDKDAEDRK